MADNLLRTIEVVGLSGSLAEARLAEIKTLIDASDERARQTAHRERPRPADSSRSAKPSKTAGSKH
jgi:hypothetical protein